MAYNQAGLQVRCAVREPVTPLITQCLTATITLPFVPAWQLNLRLVTGNYLGHPLTHNAGHAEELWVPLRSHEVIPLAS